MSLISFPSRQDGSLVAARSSKVYDISRVEPDDASMPFSDKFKYFEPNTYVLKKSLPVLLAAGLTVLSVLGICLALVYGMQLDQPAYTTTRARTTITLAPLIQIGKNKPIRNISYCLIHLDFIQYYLIELKADLALNRLSVYPAHSATRLQALALAVLNSIMTQLLALASIERATIAIALLLSSASTFDTLVMLLSFDSYFYFVNQNFDFLFSSSFFCCFNFKLA
jgi:hypothetical protein